MPVTRLEIHLRTPYEGGKPFGEVGPYERVDGEIHFAVDPASPGNASIVDLDKAERGADGRIHFKADFCLLQPENPLLGNRRLLFEVVNRGRKLVPRHFNHAPAQATPSWEIDPGDGFLFRHGWSVAWCGWQWDVYRDEALMGLEAPQAVQDGQPIQGQVAIEFQPNEPTMAKLLANRLHQPYPAADVDGPDAVLTVRDTPTGPRATIPRERWRFAKTDPDPGPADTHIWLAGGFEAGRIYEVVYRTRICPVVGTGLLAVRDCGSFLRYGDVTDGNPCAGWVNRAYAFGMSQSGRFLRHFLYLGLNLDEAGRQVYDGIIPHVAGARRGEFNHRFAQPSVQGTPGFGHRPPFTDDDQVDPDTGRSDGLLRRQRMLGGLPKIIYPNTSAEYWRGDASLIHTDLHGERDVEPPAEVRIYHFAGTQHGLGTVPLGHVSASDGCVGANGFNAVDYAPLLRATLANLDRWVSEGIEPPPSAFPRLADGTAVPAASVLDTYRRIPGAHVPNSELLPAMPRVDLGPDADRGIGRYPVALGEPYRTYVSAVDDDGNEVAGIRLPDLTVPLAACTGWNVRDPKTGGVGQLIPMQGSTFPFEHKTLLTRFGTSHKFGDEDFLGRVRAAAEELVAAGYLVAEDTDLVVRLARERWGEFAPREWPAREV